jgi:hypothetical protein
MTSQGISCVAGGVLTSAATGITVVEHPAGWIMASADHSWRVEADTQSWFVIRSERSDHVLTVSSFDETELILAALPHSTRHHWRIISYPERGDVVIISRVTGLALTAGSPEAGRPASVGLTAYRGAATQHWSFTGHPGRLHADRPEPRP